MIPAWRALTAAAALLLAAPAHAQGPPLALKAPGADDWPMYHHDVRGTRHASRETTLSRNSAEDLRVRWTFPTPGAVHGTPAVVGDTVYVGDGTGLVYALDAGTGLPVWVTNVGGPVTASPLASDDLLVVADLTGRVTALDRRIGAVRWSTVPNRTAPPAIYGSPVLITTRDERKKPLPLIVVGTSSHEELLAFDDTYPCCTARGSVAALDPQTGEIVWQRFTISEEEAKEGASGATVWTTPTYDAELDLLYFGTGNNYSEPSAGSDAVWAVRARDGEVRWTSQRRANDTWTLKHVFSDEHPNFDFADSVQIHRLTSGRKVVSAGQKSGFYHVFDAETGKVLDSEQLAPGGGIGGLFADAARVDGIVYANGHDWQLETFRVEQALEPPWESYLIAIDVRTGEIKERWRHTRPDTANAGGVAVANGLVIFHSSREGRLVVLDAATGAELESIQVGIAMNGPSVSRGRIFLGTGDQFNFFAEDVRVAGTSVPPSPVRPGGSIVSIGLPENAQAAQ